MFTRKPRYWPQSMWDACKQLAQKMAKENLGFGKWNRKEGVWQYTSKGTTFDIKWDGALRVTKTSLSLPDLSGSSLNGAETILNIILRHARQDNEQRAQYEQERHERHANFAKVYNEAV